MATSSKLLVSYMFLIFTSAFLLILLSTFHFRPVVSSTTTTSTSKNRPPHPPSTAMFLNPHNKIRAQYGLPLLTWNTDIARYARGYAHQRRRDCELIHSDTDYGENIFWGQGKNWSFQDAMDQWFVEKSFYNYKNNSCLADKVCTHYTQLVWKYTLNVGCAKIRCDNGDTFITCNYDPHGNIIGVKPY
ncbi:hypothetical protein MKW94_023765 [Papaver nudicaule]|uniref:SCP domain-containing protein n=1 Tax=Papaver nudicaule TaxID=74823 RepID=A0AA41W382_PAPNU|nr:hypothetical protein [Papaver nudicaule]